MYHVSPFRIGGPGSSLPFFMESFLGWSLCLSCLAVSGYHYGKSILLSSRWYSGLLSIIKNYTTRHRRLMQAFSLRVKSANKNSDSNLVLDSSVEDGDESPWIPLTTHSRAELERKSPWDRYLDLIRVIETRHPDALLESSPADAGMGDLSNDEGINNQETEDTKVNESSTSSNDNGKCQDSMFTAEAERKADSALIHAIRSDDICRRLASLAMRPYEVVVTSTTSIAMTTTTTVTILGHSPCSFSGVDQSIQSNSVTEDQPKIIKTHTKQITTSLTKQHPKNQLIQRLSKLWGHFLVLPPLEESRKYSHQAHHKGSESEITPETSPDENFQISLILPAFQERGSHLASKLTTALKSASDPHKVEVIIVDAGGCDGLDCLLDSNLKSTENKQSTESSDLNRDKPLKWGKIIIIPYTKGGGRGPCLNYGAELATGKILTFCHSDTSLPKYWDERIFSTLDHGGVDDCVLSSFGVARANSCAFSFGIDTTTEGLSMPFASSSTTAFSNSKCYFPPGIRAVETTANMRTHLYSLPYGDQVLSLHACIFKFLGGFPDQCLMEDYELVSLLRQRAALFVPPSASDISYYSHCQNRRSQHSNTTPPAEHLTIIAGPPALCSPRRWQKFGVLYVTYMNSKFVNLYAGASKLGPDELFHLYYGRDPPEREFDLTPWELELESALTVNSFP